MIGRIRGVLLEKMAHDVLVDVQGVAYEIQVPLSTLFQLPETGTLVQLHTHFVVREDAQLLYGFFEQRERELFRILIRINGVGPKMALAILSGMETDDFVRCVQNNDINTLVKLPGVGKKTAERLLIEVRDRLKEWGLDTAAATGAPRAQQSASDQSLQEAESALVGLGYKPVEASKLVKAASKQLEDSQQPLASEALIRLALRSMA